MYSNDASALQLFSCVSLSALWIVCNLLYVRGYGWAEFQLIVVMKDEVVHIIILWSAPKVTFETVSFP